MRNGSRLLSLIVAFAMAVPIMSSSAMADGITIRHDTALDAWSAVTERDQFCIINFQDGIEKMIISVQLDATELGSADTVAWLVPLPAPPEQVSLRLMSIVPRLNGTPFSSVVSHEIADDPMWLYGPYASQLYLLPFAAARLFMPSFGGTSAGLGDDVQTFGSVVGFGVTSEVIGTNSSDALDQYMSLRGLALLDSAKTVVDDYVGRDYSLVLSWISNVSGFRRTAMTSYVNGVLTYAVGLAVEFPTDRIFFPLKLTGAYGSMDIPITIQVLGHVTPADFSSGDEVRLSWGYYVEDEYEPVSQNDLMDDYKNYVRYSSILDFVKIRRDFLYFFEEQAPPPPKSGYYLTDIDYTTLSIEGSAAGLSEDLWLTDAQPVSVSAFEAVGAVGWLIPIVTLLVASCISGLLSSFIVLPGHPVPARRFAVLGLLNALTLLGVYLGYIFLIEKKAPPRDTEFFRKSCSKYVWCFSFVFLLIVVSVHAEFFLLSLI